MAITSVSFLTKGSQVEIGSHEAGSNGAWYSATVICPPSSTTSPNHTTSNSLVYVEYHNLLSEDGSSNRLREYANVAYVRPAPVSETGPIDFQLNDLVDAFYRDGWWTGVITTVVDASNFVVTLENPPEEIQFRCEDLRIHKKWTGGRWIQPQKQETAGWMFTVGKKVEVSFEKESLQDVWFPATVLKNSGNSTFLVEYQPGVGNEAIIHTTVDYLHIRPSPPYLKDKNFVVSEKVDAYYDFGWRCGVITKELSNNSYNVLFKHTKREQEFICSKVRPHMEWKRGKWFNTSQDDIALRTTDNQIEQATPVTAKESPVATSTVKRKRRDLDNNDTASPNDEITNVDSSKKTKHLSDGQSKGFDSEVSGTTDQAVSKTEDLSHGKKVGGMVVRTTQSLVGKQPFIPTVILKRHKTSPNNESMNVDSSKKKTPPSVGQSKSFDSEVNGTTDQAVSKTEDLSHGKKVGDTDVGTTDSLIDNQTEQATPIISTQSPVATSIMEEKTQNSTESNDETSPSDEIVNADSSTNKIQPTDGQSEDVEMTDKEKREKNTEMKASTIGSKRKKGGLNKELKSLQASTKESEVDLFRTRTQESEAKKDATKNSPLDEKTSSAAKSDTKQPDVPSAPLAVVDQEGSDGDVVSVPLEKKTKKNLSRKGKRRKRRTISVNTEIPAQVSVVSEDASKEKADESLEKDSTTNPEASVGKSMNTVPDDQQLNVSVEKPVEESTSRAGTKLLDLGSLPFIRNMALWKTLESMEAFRKLPQKPHFRPLLEGAKEGAREGLAIGAMVTFATAVDQTCNLKFDDSRSTIKDCLETLVELEDNGFEVEVLRKRLTEFLSIKDQHEKLVEESKGFVKEFEEHDIQDKEIVEEIVEMNRQLRELEEIRALALVKKEKRDSEIGAMEGIIEGIKQEIKEIDAEFDRLTKAPFVEK